MKWDSDDIFRIILGGAGGTAVATIIARGMGWIRFGKTDRAKISKVQSETAIDLAMVNSKKIEDEVKISDAALRLCVSISTQLEKANMLIEKQQTEKERLQHIIDVMKIDFEKAFDALKKEFTQRVKELEEKLEVSREELIEERSRNWEEIAQLKKQINGRGN